MKKVSILSLHLNYGGIEKSICALANLLCKRYDVEIVCTYKIVENPSFDINQKIKIKYLTNVTPNKKEIMEALKRKKFISLIRECIKSVKVLWLKKHSMKEYIKQTDANFIISTRYLFNKLLGKYSRNDVIKIGWEHNHYHVNMLFARKVIKSVKKLNYLVLVSKNLKEFYSKRLKNTNCVCVYIPNILDDLPSNKSNLKNKNLISVGRLSKEKGYLDLLEIYSKIIKTYPDWKLDIIGDGKERKKLEKYIKDKKLEEKVFLHGFQNKNYINNILLNSSIYLMTSFTESFGIVLIEAMSYGIPCVAFSSAEGATELIENGKNGYLIDNRNKEQYVEKIEYLIKNENIRIKMSEKCIETSLNYLGENIIKLWYEIL